MNKFEALHTLGLDGDVDPQDIKLAYHGIQTSIDASEFWDVERLQVRVTNFLTRAKQARDFLLKGTSKEEANEKISVSRAEGGQSELAGLEHLRSIVVSYLNEYKGRRAWCIGAITLCIIASFVILRYLRAAPRAYAFAIIALIAIAASTILTSAIVQIRRAHRHALTVEERITTLKDELGITEEEDTV